MINPSILLAFCGLGKAYVWVPRECLLADYGELWGTRALLKAVHLLYHHSPCCVCILIRKSGIFSMDLGLAPFSASVCDPYWPQGFKMMQQGGRAVSSFAFLLFANDSVLLACTHWADFSTKGEKVEMRVRWWKSAAVVLLPANHLLEVGKESLPQMSVSWE